MSDPSSNATSGRAIFTPTSLNRLARELIEDTFPSIWIEAELSNVSRPSSGHLYFTLKDSAAQVRCAMFKPRSTWLPFKPVDGMQVLARARVSLYEARGDFQLIAEHMELAGEGALRREFERLKARLSAEGLFDASRKRPLPPLPRRLGIITSATGAAVLDVLNVLGRRFPMVDVEILPVPVQGKEAPPAIAAMIQAASHAMRHDVLLVTRGGGSLEDLWAFNDESVARAIAESEIPIVSAIGHEVDFTIADFVADLRAPTPSAAAELLVPDSIAIANGLRTRFERMRLRFARQLQALNQRVDHLSARLNLQRPSVRLQRGRERLTSLHARLVLMRRHLEDRRQSRLQSAYSALLAQHPGSRLDSVTQRNEQALARLQRAITQSLERRRAHAAELARALHAVSPLATLGRGYSILTDAESGKLVGSVHDAKAGMLIDARLVDGTLRLKLESNN
jgi:exodeoxyribonuclease VII large subunit